VSSCAWYLVASPAEAGDMSGLEGVGEWVGGEGGQSGHTAGVSPPLGVSPFVFLPPCGCPAHLTSLV
jgi:hypothetical protein